MRLECSVGVMTDIAAAPPALIFRAGGVHHVQPVQVLADHGSVAASVVPETGVVRGDGLVQHRLLVAGETEFEGVWGSIAGLIFIVISCREGRSEQIFIFAAVGSMT